MLVALLSSAHTESPSLPSLSYVCTCSMFLILMLHVLMLFAIFALYAHGEIPWFLQWLTMFIGRGT